MCPEKVGTVTAEMGNSAEDSGHYTRPPVFLIDLFCGERRLAQTPSIIAYASDAERGGAEWLSRERRSSRLVAGAANV